MHWRDGLLHGAALVGVFALTPSIISTGLEGAIPGLAATTVPIEQASLWSVGSFAVPVHGPVLPATGEAPTPDEDASLADTTTIAQISDATEIEASQAATASPSAPAAQWHTVRTGDTLSGIAASYGLRPETIAAANSLSSPNHIQAGQVLRIGESTSASVAGRQPSNSQEAFILSLVRGAQTSQRVTGVPASVTIAQAILETYWGTSFLAREANNYFGIKSYAKQGSAGVVWIDAWEVENGKDVNRPEPFRRYNDPAESLVDHGRFFLENSRYAYALQATDDPREFARRINAAGYATDPAYASKLISYMDRYNLYQWDISR